LYFSDNENTKDDFDLSYTISKFAFDVHLFSGGLKLNGVNPPIILSFVVLATIIMLVKDPNLS
jgi:hypothetical protein